MSKADRYEIDLALWNAVPHGAYTKLADLRGVKVNNISKYYDPHNLDYQSAFSRAILELKTVSQACPEWGRAILQVVNDYGVQFCGTGDVRAVGGVIEDVITLAAKLQNPATPVSDRMPLALDLQRKVAAVVSGLQFDDEEDAGDARLRGVSKVAVRPLVESIRAGRTFTDKSGDPVNESPVTDESLQTEFDRTTRRQGKR